MSESMCVREWGKEGGRRWRKGRKVRKCNTHEFCGVEFEGGKEKGGREGDKKGRREITRREKNLVCPCCTCT